MLKQRGVKRAALIRSDFIFLLRKSFCYKKYKFGHAYRIVYIFTMNLRNPYLMLWITCKSVLDVLFITLKLRHFELQPGPDFCNCIGVCYKEFYNFFLSYPFMGAGMKILPHNLGTINLTYIFCWFQYLPYYQDSQDVWLLKPIIYIKTSCCPAYGSFYSYDYLGNLFIF